MLSSSACRPGRSRRLLYVAWPASQARQNTFDQPALLHASSMWRTPASPHCIPGLSIQSEWVRGALRVSFSGRASSAPLMLDRAAAETAAAAPRKCRRLIGRIKKAGSLEQEGGEPASVG